MYLGRFYLGQHVPISVQCTDGPESALPSQTPLVTIYDDNGDPVEAKRMPIVDRVAAPGLFILMLRLTSAYSPGHYSAAVQYIVASNPQLQTCYFEVVAGGSVNGAVISMQFYDRPQAKFLVQKLDSFQRNIIKNPRSS